MTAKSMTEMPPQTSASSGTASIAGRAGSAARVGNTLIISDMAHTGFGRVGRELANGLLARGHDIRIIAINYRGFEGELAPVVNSHLTDGNLREATRERIDELLDDPLTDRMVPAAIQVNGVSHSHGHGLTMPAVHGQVWKGWHASGVLYVSDAYAALLRLLDVGSDLRTVPVWNYVPIEGGDLPKSWELIYRFMHPVAMSEFGRRELEKLLGRSVPCIPHGASAAFRPLTGTHPGKFKGKSIASKDAAKDAFGFRGRTVILRVDRHIQRKNYAALFRVMRPVLARHPEAVVVIHARAQDEYGNLHDLISREPGAVNTDPNSVLGWVHPQYLLTGAHDTFRGLSDEELNVLYNAADLLVSPTMAEGFGLTFVEATAAGVPVITTDYAAGPEVVGPGGVLIPPVAYVTNQYGHEWAIVNEPAMSEAVERLVSKPALRRELGKVGQRHAAQFTWDAAADAFDRLLTQPAAVAA